ncbi:MAG: chemotaxis protein CheX [Phycisphaerae bacterium]
MDVRYINPFIEAVQNLFKTMLSTGITVNKPQLKGKDTPLCDITAIIGFSGDATGSAALCFANEAAVAIAGKFAGAELSVDDPDFADALGELANMVAGQAKSKIHDMNISISLPQVIAGANQRILKSGHNPVLVLPCDSPLGRFTIEVAMVMEKTASPSAPNAASV